MFTKNWEFRHCSQLRHTARFPPTKAELGRQQYYQKLNLGLRVARPPCICNITNSEVIHQGIPNFSPGRTRTWRWRTVARGCTSRRRAATWPCCGSSSRTAPTPRWKTRCVRALHPPKCNETAAGQPQCPTPTICTTSPIRFDCPSAALSFPPSIAFGKGFKRNVA